MAITQNKLTEGESSVQGLVYTTASFTTVAGRLTLLCISSQPVNDGDNPTITTDGGGRTWDVFSGDATGGFLYYDSTSSGSTLKVFGTTSGGTGTIELTYPRDQVACCWSVSEFVGANGYLQLVKSTPNITGLTPSITLGTFGSVNNGTFLVAATAGNRTYTPGAGFTEISDLATYSTNQDIFTEWRASNDTSADCTLSGTGTPIYGAMALELVASASASYIASIASHMQRMRQG